MTPALALPLYYATIVVSRFWDLIDTANKHYKNK
jgi:hypothetical protein